ncbi:MAG: histidine kinase [Chitinophagaceae bacterium]
MPHNKARYFIEIVIHLLFWLAVYYALNALTASSFNIVNTDDGKVSRAMNGRLLFPHAVWVLGVLLLLFYGYIYWLFKKVIRYKSKIASLSAIAGWFVLLFVINYFVVRMQIGATGHTQHPDAPSPASSPRIALSMDTVGGTVSDSVTSLPGAIPLDPSGRLPLKEFSTEDWWDMQLVMAIIFLAVLGVAIAYFFIKEWIRNNLVRSQAEAQQFSTEVKFLRSQVNPHFLFNTLNNLFSMAQKKGDSEVANGISKLSGMMRYMIYESNTDRVPLLKEIEYLEDCIALNKLRYADNEVTVKFDYPEQGVIAGVQVAPMLFIPFLENAFKHGVLIGHHSGITIAIAIDQKTLIFTCENTDYSAVKKLAEEQSGIGLENVKRRLQLVYPGMYTLQAKPENGIYKVNLEIHLA